MLKRFALLACVFLAALALSGCQNSGQDSDENSYDTVGETHVYDLPKKVLPARPDSAPPTTFIPQQRAKIATKSYDHIGEENVFDE